MVMLPGRRADERDDRVLDRACRVPRRSRPSTSARPNLGRSNATGVKVAGSTGTVKLTTCESNPARDARTRYRPGRTMVPPAGSVGCDRSVQTSRAWPGTAGRDGLQAGVARPGRPLLDGERRRGDLGVGGRGRPAEGDRADERPAGRFEDQRGAQGGDRDVRDGSGCGRARSRRSRRRVGHRDAHLVGDQGEVDLWTEGRRPPGSRPPGRCRRRRSSPSRTPSPGRGPSSR